MLKTFTKLKIIDENIDRANYFEFKNFELKHSTFKQMITECFRIIHTAIKDQIIHRTEFTNFMSNCVTVGWVMRA